MEELSNLKEELDIKSEKIIKINNNLETASSKIEELHEDYEQIQHKLKKARNCNSLLLNLVTIIPIASTLATLTLTGYFY